MDKVREAIINGDVGGAAKAYVESKKRGHDVDNKIEIVVGEEMFSFDTFERWVNKASSWYAQHGAVKDNSIAIDNAGRICYIGKHLARARDEDAFPVRVFNIL